jgi:hypothetical protein
MTRDIPGGTLSNDGDCLRVRMGGTFAASVNNKQLKFYYGATVVLDTGALAVTLAGSWDFEMLVMRTGAATQRITVRFNTSQAAMLANAAYVTATETLSGSVTVKATGTATADNDITQTMMLTELVKSAFVLA